MYNRISIDGDVCHGQACIRGRIHQRVMHALAHFAESSRPGQTMVIRDRSQSVRRNKAGGVIDKDMQRDS